ncbi:PAS domain S-box protein [soil metagenome]
MTKVRLQSCAGPLGACVAVTVAACVLALTHALMPLPLPVVLALCVALICAAVSVLFYAARHHAKLNRERDAHINEAREQTARLTELNNRLAMQSREIAGQAVQMVQQRDGYKKLAGDLAEKQVWIDAVITQLPAGILLVDTDLNVVNRNERFREQLGLPANEPSPKSLMDLHGWPAKTPEGKPIIFQDWPLMRALRDGVTIHDFEMCVGVKGGGWFQAAVSASPIRGPGGDIRGGVLLINDLTVRRQSEERLKLLESAVVHANDAIIVLEAVSASGKGRSVKYVNDAFTRLTGYQRDDVIGRSLHFLRGQNSNSGTLKELRIALDTATPFRTELLNYRKDRSVFWVDLSLVPVQGPDGRCTHYIMIQRDITDRKIAEGSLRESEELFRGIFETTSAGVSITDDTGKFVSCNPAFATMVGRTVQEVIACSPADISHPEDWAAQQQFINAVTEGKIDRYQFPKRYLKPDGSVIWSELTFAAIYDSDGEYQYGLGVSVDVSSRRTLEEQLRQAQKMEALGQLAGGIAHDFNNLLTAVLGNLALMKLPAEDPNRELLATVEQAASRAADLTRKLLGYARRNQLLVAPVQPSVLFDEVVSILRRTLDPRIEMVVRERTEAYVSADATLIHQALMNLCINARDAMPEGGVLTLASEEVTVTPDHLPHTEARPGHYVKLSVTDTGHGISDAVRERLFEPFFTTKGVGKGTGLGLPMVHGIMKQHDGWVSLDTTLGKGSCFTLYLPTTLAPALKKTAINSRVPAAEETPVPSIVDTPAPPLRRMTILVVDDEDMIRNLGRSILEMNHYEVLCASDGAEAIDIFETEYRRISLVVLDLTMPRLSGRDTFIRLKQIDPDVRVLFSSGYAAEEVTEIDTSAGLLSKPYRPNDLLQAVRRAIRRTRESVGVSV